MGSCNSQMQRGIVTESNAAYMYVPIQKYQNENSHNTVDRYQKNSKSESQCSKGTGNVLPEKQNHLVRQSWFKLQDHLTKNIGAVMFIQ